MTKTQLLDGAERTLATFAETFLALLIADSTGVTQISDIKIAAISAGLAAAKYLVVQLNKYLGAT